MICTKKTDALTDTTTMMTTKIPAVAPSAAGLVDTAEFIPATLQTAELTDAAAMVAAEFSTATSLPMGHHLERRSGSTRAVSKLRTTNKIWS